MTDAGADLPVPQQLEDAAARHSPWMDLELVPVPHTRQRDHVFVWWWESDGWKCQKVPNQANCIKWDNNQTWWSTEPEPSSG